MLSTLRPVLFSIVALAVALPFSPLNAQENDPDSWREKSVGYGRIMSQVKWTPVAEGMPCRGGFFEKGKEYTGTPYSSVKSVGRYIGFDIYLKTFLAAVENPKSVLYTKSLEGKISNAECYYGKVCSSYTSYGLQCGFWVVSRRHGPDFRDGVALVEPQSAQGAMQGDVIYRPPSKKGGGAHIELVTGVTRGDGGSVTHVRVEESRPQTTLDTNYEAADFNAHLKSKNKALYRITDLDAWRGENRADRFLFPNYAEDSATPAINRVLLLDRGDWVAYRLGETVEINIMDRDNQGVESLVIEREGEIVETIERPGKGVQSFDCVSCGSYTAYCVKKDGSKSEACEFSVCDLDFKIPDSKVEPGKPLEFKFQSSENMNVIAVHVMSHSNSFGRYNVFLTDEDREKNRVVIPGDLLKDAEKTQIWLIGENRYGRLKQRYNVVVKTE